MSRAVCPGSFDPITLGHLDVVTRAARLFDEVVVAVGVNPSKSRLFSPEERLEMLTRAVADLPNVRVEGFTGLVTDFCTEQDAVAIVKGLRAASDFDYELPMAHMNTALTSVETVFLPTSTGRSFVSSSLVKEVASLGGDVSAFVPDFVLEALTARLAAR
ncbi:pantetheine-phosphate adenylyltransferase [Nocardioides marinquilinus]|uniref:Phosphopantetheine adenylyltransferase n=1 Tax=Nocardioides marinquilinus TaxID=1210400 RepID=A0ABP9PUX3_9ACTN